MSLAVVIVGLTGVLVGVIVWPNVRAAVGVYVGVAWLLLCWFAFARTRTLTLGGFALLYSLCVPWSVVVGLVSLRLADLMPTDWIIHGAAADGPTIGIAAITEESLKLVPVAVLAVLAPGRVRRFAAVDWLLVGFAAGAAFLTVEEVQRRLAMLAPGGRGLLDFCSRDDVNERLRCYGMVQFGPNPFSSKIPFSGTGGLFGLGDVDLTYAGHHVMTALVTAGLGLGIVLWRSAVRVKSFRWGMVASVVAVTLPLSLFWVAVADHAVFNASTIGGSLFGSSDPWATSSVPVVFKFWYYVGGHGHARTWLLLVLLLVGMLTDAARARHRGYWSIALPFAGPHRAVWAERAARWWRSRLTSESQSGPVRWGSVFAGVLGGAVLSLAYVTGRDVSQALACHARQRDESRLDAMIRGRVMLMMQRETREIAADLDAGTSPRGRLRLVAVVLLLGLLVLGLVVAPYVAASIGWDTSGGGTRWLAGIAERLGHWWDTLSPAQQVGLTLLAAFALALPFGFGWGLFLAGGLTYLLEHGNGLGSLLRNPRQATRSYLENRSVGGMALDVGEFALTFVPAGVGAGAGTAVRSVGRDYLADPVAWRAWVRAEMKENGERGAVSWGHADGLPRVNGSRPRGFERAGTVYKGEASATSSGWSAATKARYPAGVRYTKDGFPEFAPYATHTVKLPKFTGLRRLDDAAANKLAGLARKPAGYTWHHVEDGHTMMLVPRDLHAAVSHTGGHAIVKPPK